ncbi:RNA polymerase sigma factor for flagellar operon [Bacillus methanolicus PB1]|uniref:RNA polymerase sigma factor for flagellar operon n=1 Tax=Bacillus methanolicus PB1 TaxID=997296 RepID=I3DY29_BACMT|nr:sigma-70 family RNA polymerase sigma factor [Bacillus methanolicus]EIJ79150.1 RNA polymerase sigma factor for flagellar operon [Bacillus methanolicus PB1]
MRWELATDEQLWNIIENDWHVPERHIDGLVTEALNRNLFDHLIKHLINKMFDRWDPERRYNFSDLYQIGYIGIVQALKNYKVGKGSFKTFAYMNIKTEFVHHLEKINAEKRKLYENILSLDVQKHEDNDSTFLDSLIDETKNPEKITINKLFLEEQFKKLSQREREILLYFTQGYSMHEIAKMYKQNGAAWISRQFHRGIAKINPSYQKTSLKDLGLVTGAKGAIA